LLTREEILDLPDLSSGQVLVMVEAEATDALANFARHDAVTGGVRIAEA